MLGVITTIPYVEKIDSLLLDPQLGTRQIPGTENLSGIHRGGYSNCHGTTMYILGVYDARRPYFLSPVILEKILQDEQECQAKEANLVIFNLWEAGFRQPIDHSAIPLYNGESDPLEVTMFEQAGSAQEFGLSKVGLRIETAERGDFVCRAVFYNLNVDRAKRNYHALTHL